MPELASHEDAAAELAAPGEANSGSSGGGPVEPTRERLARHARGARLYASAGLFIVFLVVLILLASANAHTVKVDWVVGSTRASLVWVILAAAVVGWLLGIVTAVLARHRMRPRR